jgi:hypothetical protein
MLKPDAKPTQVILAVALALIIGLFVFLVLPGQSTGIQACSSYQDGHTVNNNQGGWNGWGGWGGNSGWGGWGGNSGWGGHGCGGKW